MVMSGAAPALALSSSKPISVPGDFTSQSAGTSKAVPHFGFTTTFQPATVGCSASEPRGLSSEADAGEDAEAESLGSADREAGADAGADAPGCLSVVSEP